MDGGGKDRESGSECPGCESRVCPLAVEGPWASLFSLGSYPPPRVLQRSKKKKKTKTKQNKKTKKTKKPHGRGVIRKLPKQFTKFIATVDITKV